MSRWVNTGTVARELGVHVATVRYWVHHDYCLSGRLPSGRIIIPKSELERLRGTTSATRWQFKARARAVSA